MILIFEVTKVKSRWLQPILFAVPILLVLQAWPRLTPRRVGGILSVAGLCAALVLVLLPLRTFEGPSIGRLNPLHSPYRRLSAEIRAFEFQQGSILASFNLLGGNMRLQFPQSVVVTPEYPRIKPLPPGPVLVVWEATRDRRLPRKLSRLFERLTGRKLPVTKLQYVSARLLYAPDHRLGLGLIVIEDWRQLPALK
jgi:hypothetical protein